MPGQLRSAASARPFFLNAPAVQVVSALQLRLPPADGLGVAREKARDALDPAAPPPMAWLEFLDRVWREDNGSITCLQEWFGYLLHGDTRQQKTLIMVGPKRSGRSTIARVLKALAGASNVVNPTPTTRSPPSAWSH